ncbi:permease-like cell division protein FtsX [Alkalihalobacillus pseudalcaliphilus]|uniref:permease-like cell division protein FtsX n=1 Tax=Alkalihalobacillus pseudalcaliphilus TaxID=79884 RepID=UPI00064D80AE|nr:permease-like cell division protein FtsX [Alkalihalobacillus pseudalcaliphilus]KMK77450.1 cell division protein FtsX [Alkalihalobacillus pseudalcaliphilus]
MKLSTLGRHIKEGTKNLARNGWMTFASVSAVTIMLFVVGVFFLLIFNVNHLTASVEDNVEIRVHIDLTASEENQDELREEILALSDVESVDFVGREEGLNQLIDSMDSVVFESFRGDENPLNDVFVVRAGTPQLTEPLALEITEFTYVESVYYGEDIIENLFTVTNFIRVIGAVLVVGMLFTAIFLIANTIKLTIVARQREIKIMKLVGATNGFIRWPFFIEGFLLGIIGSIIPVLIIAFGYNYLFQNFDTAFQAMNFSLLSPSAFIWQISFVIVGIGAIVGVWGSLMSVRKFLKV